MSSCATSRFMEATVEVIVADVSRGAVQRTPAISKRLTHGCGTSVIPDATSEGPGGGEPPALIDRLRARGLHRVPSRSNVRLAAR